MFGVYKYRQPHPNPLLGDLPEGASAITPYVRIDVQGVTIITPRAEMGQGIHTTLAALVAEELDVAWKDIRVDHGPPGAAYYNRALMRGGVPFAALDQGQMAETMRGTMGVLAKFMGIQGTGGSSSVPDAFDKMRAAGAAARSRWWPLRPSVWVSRRPRSRPTTVTSWRRTAGGCPTPHWPLMPPRWRCPTSCC